MILELTQHIEGLPILIGINANRMFLDRGTYTCIGTFNGDTYVEVKETIEEIKQQIKEGGVK